MCLQGERGRGDKRLPGRFVLPEGPGTEGHSRCGCHGALTASQEDTGAAGRPRAVPGLCQSQPAVSRARGAARPVPGAGCARTGSALPKGETGEQLRSERPSQADLSCSRAVPCQQILGAHRDSDNPLLICASAEQWPNPRVLPLEQEVCHPPLPQGHRGQVSPALCPQACCCHILRDFLLCLNLGSGSGLAPPGLSQPLDYAWQSTHCPGRSCQALAGHEEQEKPALCHPQPPEPGLALQGSGLTLLALLGVLGMLELEGVESSPARRAPAGIKNKIR